MKYWGERVSCWGLTKRADRSGCTHLVFDIVKRIWGVDGETNKDDVGL